MAPLLLDINAPEFVILLVIAVILFGPEKLPELARKVARLVQAVRAFAGNAQQQLTRELGPGFEDFDLRDLQPKAFVQKHLLDDVQPIVADVKAEVTEVRTTVTGGVGEVTQAINGAKQVTPGGPHDLMRRDTPTPYDPDAT